MQKLLKVSTQNSNSVLDSFWLFIPSYRAASVLERDSYFLANFFSVIIAVCLVYNNFVTCVYAFSFSGLTPLVGWQEGHPACKN